VDLDWCDGGCRYDIPLLNFSSDLDLNLDGSFNQRTYDWAIGLLHNYNVWTAAAMFQ